MASLIDALRAAPPRTWLFVPGARCAELFPKALRSGADAVIIDLEDSVATQQRGTAHEQLRSLQIASAPPVVFVRVSSHSDDILRSDLRLAVAARAHGLVLPKVHDSADITNVVSLLEEAESAAGGMPLAIVPLIETALGLTRAVEIGRSHSRIAGLAFGAEDLTRELGAIRSPQGSEIATARALIVIAAAAAGCGAIDTPWLDLRDADGAAQEARQVCALGFAGKLLVHPAQVRPVASGFEPSPDELRRAVAIIQTFETSLADGSAVAVLAGRVIDLPIVQAARRVLARAGAAATEQRST